SDIGSLSPGFHVRERGAGEGKLARRGIRTTFDLAFPGAHDFIGEGPLASLSASLNSDSEIGAADFPIGRASDLVEFEGHGKASIRRITSASVNSLDRPARR